MNRQFSRALVLVATLVMTGCGGGSSGGGSPTAPSTPATPAMTSIQVVGNAAAPLGLGLTYPYFVFATYANGFTDVPTAGITWRTSSSSIATITQAGMLTPVNPGTVVVTASLQGKTGSMSVLVERLF